MNNTKKIIVFGGGGFLGSHVADYLTKDGHDVTIFDIQESKHINNKQKMIIGDILNEGQVKKALEGNQYVYHFAGLDQID